MTVQIERQCKVLFVQDFNAGNMLNVLEIVRHV